MDTRRIGRSPPNSSHPRGGEDEPGLYGPIMPFCLQSHRALASLPASVRSSWSSFIHAPNRNGRSKIGDARLELEVAHSPCVARATAWYMWLSSLLSSSPPNIRSPMTILLELFVCISIIIADNCISFVMLVDQNQIFHALSRFRQDAWSNSSLCPPIA